MTQILQLRTKRGGGRSPPPASGGIPRFLVSVTVLGSAGPIRFVVGEGESVASVIGTALKLYAREGRLPVLGSDLNNFFLYAANAGSDALKPWETISSLGSRSFVMCAKPPAERIAETPKPKNSVNLKAWINKSLTFKISSH